MAILVTIAVAIFVKAVAIFVAAAVAIFVQAGASLSNNLLAGAGGQIFNVVETLTSDYMSSVLSTIFLMEPFYDTVVRCYLSIGCFRK